MPKITKQGPTWANDPSRVPDQRDGEQVPDDEMNESSVNGDLRYPDTETGTEVEEAGTATPPGAPADDYDDKEAWPYASLQAECVKRELGPVNGVSRDDLVKRLRENDASTTND